MNLLRRAINALASCAVGDSPARAPFAPTEGEGSGSTATSVGGQAGLRKPPSVSRTYDIFVSYRRDKGSEVARFLANRLTQKGYRVFLDVDSLGAGEWGRELSDRIDECPDFIAVITEGYFVRCAAPDDVVRREIARAIDGGSTIVPILVGEGRIPADLPTDIEGISAHNGVRYLHEYANEAVDKICTFLRSTPLLGPERLGTGESQPRVVLLAVLFTIGVWRGATIGEEPIGQYAWWVIPLIGFGFGLIYVAAILVPVLIGLTIYGKTRGIRSDFLYAGPWTSFWVFVIPFMYALTSIVIPLVQLLTGFRSYFLGGLLGGVLAVCVTRLICETNLWAEVTGALGFSRSVSRHNRVPPSVSSETGG